MAMEMKLVVIVLVEVFATILMVLVLVSLASMELDANIRQPSTNKIVCGVFFLFPFLYLRCVEYLNSLYSKITKC